MDTSVAVSVGVGVFSVGVIVWRMGAGFAVVSTRLGGLETSVNRRFDKNDADHEDYSDTLRTHGEDLAVLKDRSDQDGDPP